MRKWKNILLADIIVSELLGSFGDNELSPECLDKVLIYLKPNGISIPRNYSSWLAPISTSLIWNLCKDMNKSETPWLVWIENQMIIDNPLKVWEFNNLPLFIGEKKNNERNVLLNWIIKLETIIHGFAGYFQCFLYNDIYISIEPSTYCSNIISWFPIYFPLKLYVYVIKGNNLKMYIRRKVCNKSIWYEWCLIKPILQTLQNSAGKHSKMSLI